MSCLTNIDSMGWSRQHCHACQVRHAWYVVLALCLVLFPISPCYRQKRAQLSAHLDPSSLTFAATQDCWLWGAPPAGPASCCTLGHIFPQTWPHKLGLMLSQRVNFTTLDRNNEVLPSQLFLYGFAADFGEWENHGDWRIVGWLCLVVWMYFWEYIILFSMEECPRTILTIFSV